MAGGSSFGPLGDSTAAGKGSKQGETDRASGIDEEIRARYSWLSPAALYGSGGWARCTRFSMLECSLALFGVRGWRKSVLGVLVSSVLTLELRRRLPR